MDNWIWIEIIADVAQDFTFLAFALNCFFWEHMFTFFPLDNVESELQVMDLWPGDQGTQDILYWDPGPGPFFRISNAQSAKRGVTKYKSLILGLHTNICSQHTHFAGYWPFELRAGVYLSLMAHGIYEKRPHKSQMLGDLLSCNLRPWQDPAEI